MIDLITIFWILVCLALFILILLSAVLYSTSERYPVIVRHDEELYYKCGENLLVKKKFPKLSDPPTKRLSVVVPAYNEVERLPPMLDECIEYLEGRSKGSNFTYEVLIVDDGSSDNTSGVALKYAAQLGEDKVRVLTLVQNRGKGGAVRLGMLSARGELLLFADADGATKFADFAKLEKVLEKIQHQENPAIIIGSRAHLAEQSVAERSLFRSILMYGFHILVWLFAVRNIKDTQCGFKLMTRDAAKILFTSIHLERWAFDVEMLFIAQKLKFSIDEVSVRWTEIDGSKITPFWSALEMGRDLILIWYRYLIGAWAIRPVGQKTK